MSAVHARTRTLLLCAALAATLSFCNRRKGESPAPDMAAQQGSTSPAEGSGGEGKHAAGKAIPGEPDYVHLDPIIKAGENAKGKFARMQLKLKAKPKQGWITVLATDGSYLSGMLHYGDEFSATVNEMQPGYVYEIDFQIEKVTTGGLPVGEMLAIDRKSSAPVADKTYFLPAIEAVKKAENLPPEVKEARRQEMRKQLEGAVEYVEQRQGGGAQNTPAAGSPSAAPAAPPEQPKK